MPQKVRLSQVIDRHCVEEGKDALKAFESFSTLEKRYPAVAAHIEEHEVGKRHAAVKPGSDQTRAMSKDEIVTDVARPYLEQRLSEHKREHRSEKPEPKSPDKPTAVANKT